MPKKPWRFTSKRSMKSSSRWHKPLCDFLAVGSSVSPLTITRDWILWCRTKRACEKPIGIGGITQRRKTASSTSTKTANNIA